MHSIYTPKISRMPFAAIEQRWQFDFAGSTTRRNEQ